MLVTIGDELRPYSEVDNIGLVRSTGGWSIYDCGFVVRWR